ncbi:cytochrome c oxidase accessory protein CcoG [Marinospirillum sp.]|uniref:cytochrome c oxidase accessory protein CcoG n=1 Tax=Marinospirillum sp. TaxID=2183934 RepID=UPI003A8B94D5
MHHQPQGVRLTEGFYQQLRRWISWPLLALFFIGPWVVIKGQPGFLFDFAAGRILIFGLYFSWQDLYLLTGLLIAAAFMLFALAIYWGRVWCGFACPQSIWTWIFLRIEQWTEGPPQKRQTLQMTQPHLFWWKRSFKHSLWMLVALVTSLTFTAYFIPMRELLSELARGEAPIYVWSWLLCMTLLTYLNAGLVREKICLHACPYSRFQSAMMDETTKKVSYDYVRGEPRRQRDRKQVAADACIDCTLCVQVCPTGVDIREGMQAGCIDCGACIDACDAVMVKIQQPKGLIRFASEQELSGQVQPHKRWRLAGYLSLLLLALSGVVYGFAHKTQMTAEVRRERGELVRYLGDGTLCNFYHIKVESFDSRLQEVAVRLAGDHPLQLFGPELLPLDNLGEWVAYRLCVLDASAARDLPPSLPVQLEFMAGDVHLVRSTSFLSRARGQASLTLE